MSRVHAGISLDGLLLALLGFGITRFVVADSIAIDTALASIAIGIIPLVLGLSLTLFGVALAVGSFDRSYSRTVTRWAFITTAAMAIILVMTAIDSVLRGDSIGQTMGYGLLIANVLLGGAISGVIIGDRAAANRRYRTEITRQADRATLITRILRHDVINAVTIIQGYASSIGTQTKANPTQAIQDEVDRIISTIDSVDALSNDSSGDLVPIDVTEVIASEIERCDSSHIEIDAGGTSYVSADDRFRLIVRNLLENARTHGRPTDDDTDPAIRVAVACTDGIVSISVSDNGPGIPDHDRRLLESERVPEYDDPSTGFGLQAVRLLVDRYQGDVSVAVSDGTTITVRLPATAASGDSTTAFGVTVRNMMIAAGVSIIAGIAMGVYLHFDAGLLPVIGALYAVERAIVGWITHLFHSIVFGLFFAAGLTTPVLRRFDSIAGQTVIGIVWGLVLWLFAAGIVMPIWLHLVGFEALLPNLTGPGLIGHLIWGSLMGGLYTILSE